MDASRFATGAVQVQPGPCPNRWIDEPFWVQHCSLSTHPCSSCTFISIDWPEASSECPGQLFVSIQGNLEARFLRSRVDHNMHCEVKQVMSGFTRTARVCGLSQVGSQPLTKHDKAEILFLYKHGLTSAASAEPQSSWRAAYHPDN